MAGLSWYLVGVFLLLVARFSDKDLVIGLDNGLALTPPMGWMHWERFRCDIDCKIDPNNCISERLIMQMADRLAEDGYRDAGYIYVIIDDCWSNRIRDLYGNLQPDSCRFPSGIKALADYVHSKGLKLGMYADYGFLTCAGYPGSIQHIEQDAKTFASWEVDYLKIDACFTIPYTFHVGYPKFSQALNATGRPILLSCEWPFYEVKWGIKPDYFTIAQYCNTWRNYMDVQDSWKSVSGIMEYFVKNQYLFGAAAGPGRWNDPDVLVVGDFGLTYEQSKAQFAIWAILAAPLIMSNDLRHISREARDILLNREIIAVSQDSYGRMGRRDLSYKGLEVWSRVLSGGSVAVVLFNRNSHGSKEITAYFALVDLASTRAYARDLFAHKDLGKFTNNYSAIVKPMTVEMVKLTPY